MVCTCEIGAGVHTTPAKTNPVEKIFNIIRNSLIGFSAAGEVGLASKGFGTGGRPPELMGYGIGISCDYSRLGRDNRPKSTRGVPECTEYYPLGM